MAFSSHIARLEALLDGVPGDPAGWGAGLIVALRAHDWVGVAANAERLFAASTEDEERAFLIHCGTAAAEMSGLSREIWLRRWSFVKRPESNYYCRYVRLYQLGLTAFFAGYLNEAEFRFTGALEAARLAGFVHGSMRVFFHLALICRDRLDAPGALAYLLKAQELAALLGANRFRTRIDEQLAALASAVELPGESVVAHALEVERHLRAGSVREARLALARAEACRRQLRLGRRVASLYAYLPLIHFARGRERIGQLGLGWIQDPLLLIRMLELKASFSPLTSSEQERLESLYSLHGIGVAVRAHALDHRRSEVHGVRVAAITDEQVRALLEAFLTRPEFRLSKEELCREVWGFVYDPVLHDGRIYKLIHRARGLFPGKDLVENTYGGYRLRAEIA